MMKSWVWLVVSGLVVVLAGCGGPSAAEEAAQSAGLSPDQYSSEATGANAVVSEDGSKTEVLNDADLERFGLSHYPGATVRRGNSVRRTMEGSVTVAYTLDTKDGAEKVVAWYAEELQTEGRLSEGSAVMSGKTGDGKGVLVSVFEEPGGGSRVDVQVLEGR